jgi:L-alanine-DL-glutamate epimerase-like enolase superfamily enzyme
MAPVTIRQLRLSRLHIPFKVAFRHASAERSETSSVWVEAESETGAIGRGESCPRPYVTGETLETAEAFFHRHEASIRAGIGDLPALRRWASDEGEVSANPAAWCAIELALLDLLGKERGQPVEALLSLPPLAGRFQYTAVLGDADETVFRRLAEEYARRGFRDFKIKLSGDAARDRAKVAVLRSLDVPLRVRADANNVWPDADAALDALGRLAYPFFAIEEPVGARQYDGLTRIADALGCRIVLDESVVGPGEMASVRAMGERAIVNVRVSKMGGLIRSLEMVAALRALGTGIIVGAQVGETSLPTRAALAVAAAAGRALVAQEGAFGTWLLAHDVCEPPLMFGEGGVLDVAAHPGLRRPGLGV